MTDPSKPAAATRRIEVYDSRGKVIIETEQERYIFDPANAVELANAMLRSATACGVEIKFEVERPKITDKQRAAMITRAVHVMRSLSGRKPEFIATHVVDTVLSGVA